MTDLVELKKAYKNNNVILFVGAGVSMGIGLPSWTTFINHLAEEIGFDPDIYQTFGNSIELAEYYKIKQENGYESLCQWMKNSWYSDKIRDQHRNSKPHKLIAQAKFPIIYTTNYDHWIEKSFKLYEYEYTRIIDINDFERIDSKKTQIIKFHGDHGNKESLVIDETSYYQRFEFENPLDIKLRSDVLGKTIIFIGYSLTDTNLRYLFYRLSKQWQVNQKNSQQVKSYLYTHKPNPVQKKILEQWGINMIVSEEDDPTKALEIFLSELVKDT